MRLLFVFGAAALLSLSIATAASAQTVRQPGRLSTAFQLQQGETTNRYSAAAAPNTSVASVDSPHNRSANRLWIASIFSVVAGTSFDAASSWGLREGNGLLASSNGQFGAKGLAIKAGFAAAVIVPQICLRKHQELKRAFTIGNFAEAAVFTGVSMHNLQVRNTQN